MDDSKIKKQDNDQIDIEDSIEEEVDLSDSVQSVSKDVGGDDNPGSEGDDDNGSKQNTVRELPVIPTTNMVLFPHMVVPWIVDDAHLIKLIDDVLATDRTFVMVARRPELDDPLKTYEIGTMALVLRMSKESESQAKLIIQGITRVKIRNITAKSPYLKAKIEPVQDILVEDDIETKALTTNVRQAFSRVLELAPHIPSELGGIIMGVDDPGVLADIVISHMNISVEERQSVLEAIDVKERLKISLSILNKQLEILELGHKIQSEVRHQMDRSQREIYLREQLRAIRKELGEGEDAGDDIEQLRARLEKKQLPEAAYKEAVRELERLAKMHPASSEYTVSRTYIDWMLDLPWNEMDEGELDINKAKSILDKDHYDLKKVKKRILEYLAVRKLKPDAKGPILCFAGPPGTGKTSLGRSIARAMGRKFVRISLGGMRDEAEIRGHRRTYVGSMPGRIIQGLKRAGVKNPIFMLDEIDKLGADFRGDPASALLEVLDPEQNSSFEDHYLGVEFDLSHVTFIATANVLDSIPTPLLDRMEVIELSGYTLEEKCEIAKRYLIPRQLEAHGLMKKQLRFTPKALKTIISGYTREAGVRELERKIAAVCRAVALAVASGDTETVSVKPKDLATYLGPKRYEHEVADRTSIPGVATGMAWTPTGGEILFIEATSMKGSGKLILTGKLGDVMKESAQAALSYLHANAAQYNVKEDIWPELDIHVHVPSGAIPKDGPSAGVAIFIALLSLLRNQPARSDIAMTGEITLRGLVLPVGGVKDKVLAAHRAGIKEIILPKRNKADLDEIPEQVRDALKFHLIGHLDQAANVCFSKKTGPRKNRCKKPRGK